MADKVVLGTAPITTNVVLAHGGDFTAALQSDTPWPAGVGIELRFYRAIEQDDVIVWPATIVGDRAWWDVPTTMVDTVIDEGRKVVRLHYTEPDGSVFAWGKGSVSVV